MDAVPTGENAEARLAALGEPRIAVALQRPEVVSVEAHLRQVPGLGMAKRVEIVDHLDLRAGLDDLRR